MLEQPLTKRSQTRRLQGRPKGVRINWRILLSLCLSLGVILLAYLHYDTVLTALGLLGQAHAGWLLLALGLVLLSFYSAAYVYDRALRSVGHRLNMVRLWATAIVAILLSQSVPGGGLASYAFLVESFRRRGVGVAGAALVASLETLSYVGAMLIFFTFSLFYLIAHSSAELATGASLLAGSVAVLFVGAFAFLLTRPADLLRRWLLVIGAWVMGILRQPWGEQQADLLIGEWTRARTLIAERWGELLLLIVIQLMTLLGHSLALLVVLWSLGSSASLAVVIAAFGIALITSTFNVLPGGGGTVEAVLALTLTQLGAGNEAIAAAVLFRVLNFWLLVPVAFACYGWLLRKSDFPSSHL